MLELLTMAAGRTVGTLMVDRHDSDGGNAGQPLPGGTLAVLWAVVLLELVLPVPGLLTLGALYVPAARPPWFRTLVDGLYARR